MNESNIIMFPKSPAALSDDFKQIMKKFDADRGKLWQEYELTKAALDGDDHALTKAAGPDATLAKMEAARLRAEHGDLADGQITLQAMTKLRDAIWDFNQSYAEHKRLEKRSERLLGGRR